MRNYKKHLSAAVATLLLAGGAVVGAGGAVSAAPQVEHTRVAVVQHGDHRPGHDARSRDGHDPCVGLPRPGDRDFFRWDHGISHLCESARGFHRDGVRGDANHQVAAVLGAAADRGGVSIRPEKPA
ncbi:hypothetical protein ACWEIK_29615 [Streptomyces sp. NPDC004673]